MRYGLSSTLKAAALVAIPALALAAPPARTVRPQAAAPHATGTAGRPAPAPAARPKPAARAEAKNAVNSATHSAAGIVKSVTGSSLVITSPNKKKPSSMTFELSPSTAREGKLEVGSHVSVRYRNEGKAHVATAVMARAAKGKS